MIIENFEHSDLKILMSPNDIFIIKKKEIQKQYPKKLLQNLTFFERFANVILKN